MLMLIKEGFRKTFYIFSLVSILAVINPQSYPRMSELQGQQWAPPETIPLYDLQTLPPILVADQDRTVHAFSSQWIGEESDSPRHAIVYNKWTLEQGWTTPIDVLISPSKEAKVTDAYLDKSGIFHLIFSGGDFTNANIYYSQAPAAIASDSRAWSTPLPIGENAGDPAAAVLLENKEGVLFVIYYGRESGNGLYAVSSTDHGENWSKSIPIFLTRLDEPNISLLHAISTEAGSLHAVWGVYNVGGQGRGIFYSRSDDGMEWSDPVLLADTPEGLGTQTPTIIEHNGTLFALYNIPGKIMMRRSFDDGKTWGDPIVPFPRHTGVNGTLSLVIDGNNVLHLFFGQRVTGSPDLHGMWHSIFINNRWIEPEAVIKGPRIIDTVGFKGFDPYDARAVVCQGNVILVTWRTDPGDIRANGVWFSYTVINAPESPIATLQPFTTDIATPSSLAVDPTSTPNDIAQIPFDEEPQTRNPRGWIAVGAAIIGTLGVVYLLSKHER